MLSWGGVKVSLRKWDGVFVGEGCWVGLILSVSVLSFL